ncbi:MAG TPA: hypothetical protein PLP34_06480, partial [Chitinophagaceae bacterium]|nr:hypothetical protein [Chitinophagaceae bacterium]
MRIFIFFLFLYSWGTNGLAQSNPFQVYLEPVTISGLNGLQAYAFGQAQGKWLLVGGRLDGLHRRTPGTAFDTVNNNHELMVVDPVNLQVWKAPISSLAVSIQEQLSSTNMEFHQDSNYLYILGGYGFHGATASKMTFASLCAIDVPSVITAIVNGNPFQNFIRQINDPLFKVTGGHLKKIYHDYYLIGGNSFDGNYNPMGGPSYTQVYTNSIRRFKLNDNGTTITVTHLPEIVDAAAFHRRDYNAVPGILPNGEEGVTVFSGVFQTGVDLPFLNCVQVDSSGYNINNTFQQYYNHYHCAVLPIYSAAAQEMHTIFFGGIAQYFDSAGVLVQDNNVPFVKTIARVTQPASGVMTEYKLPVEMPGYLGAGSEFIPEESIARYANDVIQQDNLIQDTTLAGYIFGGIQSTAKNIFQTNTGSQSAANHQLFKVYLIKNSPAGLDIINPQSTGSLQMQVYPNPGSGEFIINYSLRQECNVHLRIMNEQSQVVDDINFSKQSKGPHQYHRASVDVQATTTYWILLETPFERAVQKIIIHPR